MTSLAASFAPSGAAPVLHVHQFSVETASYGSVIVAGTVHSWAEHDEAVAAAWSAPGVIDVDDRIVVEYTKP